MDLSSGWCRRSRERKLCASLFPKAGIPMLTLLVWDRPNYYSSPAISRCLDAGLEVSGLTKDDIDYFDFYSLVS